MSMPRHIVITGAARGIGRALADRFLGEGWLVTGIDRDGPAIDRAGYRHTVAEVTSEADMDGAFAAAWDAAPVGAVVGNAAVTDLDHLAAVDLPFERWRKILTVNVDGAFLTGRLAARRMTAQHHGNIVFVTSSLAFLDQAKANDAPYCASKAAVEMFARVLALEVKDAGVTVNTVFPSVRIDTGFFAHLPAEERAELARPDILDASVLFLAGLQPGGLTGYSLDQERFDRDPAYRTELAKGGVR
jgi:3-oxoacyl-[acyl-carrier protein] reductase